MLRDYYRELGLKEEPRVNQPVYHAAASQALQPHQNNPSPSSSNHSTQARTMSPPKRSLQVNQSAGQRKKRKDEAGSLADITDEGQTKLLKDRLEQHEERTKLLEDRLEQQEERTKLLEDRLERFETTLQKDTQRVVVPPKRESYGHRRDAGEARRILRENSFPIWPAYAPTEYKRRNGQ